MTSILRTEYSSTKRFGFDKVNWPLFLLTFCAYWLPNNHYAYINISVSNMNEAA